MESWRLWLLGAGVPAEVAEQMLGLGYSACVYLAEAVGE